ncbi:TonB family protein [Kangiella sp. TOML190]|uniref:TonB family protein n=1 Tax=Kangiella sp. TOML190 TaxID=2931351 RepID=UPI00203DE0A2|nr:TonB family protein [Kangiella sp. TOML190]
MHNNLRCFFIVVMVFVSFSVQADFNKAVKNYEAGNYQEAFLEFHSLSEIGNKNAQYNLGFMYLDGLGTKRDLTKAYAWLKLSDEDGESQGTQDILNQLSSHIKDQAEADSYYDSIFKKYSKAAVVNELKPIFTNKMDYNFAKVVKSTLPVYPVRADSLNIEGFAHAEFKLNSQGKAVEIEIVDSYPYGVFDNATIDAIKEWEFDVAGADLDNSYRYKIKFSKSGKEYSSRTKNKIKKYKALAQKGDPVGQFYYAMYGSTVLDDDINQAELFYQSASQGLTDSQHELGVRLLRGEGCDKDIDKGLKWLITAASADLGRSQLKLSEYYGQFASAEAEQKRKFWLDKAAKSEDKESALEIAKILFDNPDYSPELVINKLDLLEPKKVKDPIRYYMLYAATYAKMKDFKKAVRFQKKANKELKKYRRVPSDMKQKLDLYKSKLKT